MRDFGRDFDGRNFRNQIAQTDAQKLARAPTPQSRRAISKRQTIRAASRARFVAAARVFQKFAVGRQIQQFGESHEGFGQKLRAAQNRPNRVAQTRRAIQSAQQRQAIARRFAQILELNQGFFGIGGAIQTAQSARQRRANLAR